MDTTVTVIDAFTMLHDFDTSDLISSRRDDVTPEDERTVSDLMVNIPLINVSQTLIDWHTGGSDRVR